MLKRLILLLLFNNVFYSQIQFSDEISIDSDIIFLPQFAKPVDLDGDQDLDLLCACAEWYRCGLYWCENLDGQGSFSAAIPFLAQYISGYVNCLETEDIDHDGDIDIIVGLTYEVLWIENNNGQFNGSIHNIYNRMAKSLIIIDADRDGDRDILAAVVRNESSYNLILFENTNGSGTFGSFQTVLNNIYFVMKGKINNDTHPDIVVGNVWYKNEENGINFMDSHSISSGDYKINANGIADLNNDGAGDVLKLGGGVFRWYENLNESESFGKAIVIDEIHFETCNSPYDWSIDTSDLDHDGDIDILFCYWIACEMSYNCDDVRKNGRICWYENLDGCGHFSEPNILSEGWLEGGNFITSADLNGDMAKDIIVTQGIFYSCSHPDGDDNVFIQGIKWYKNMSAGNDQNINIFQVKEFVVNQSGSSLGAVWFDHNNDGYSDLMVVHDNMENEKFFFNSYGQLSEEDLFPITSYQYSSAGVTCGDFNNDSHPDLYISHLGSPGTLARNNGDGTFMAVSLMTDDLSSFGSSWADYDLDGDLDLFVTVNGDNNRLYQNNGDGSFSRITEGHLVNDMGSSRNAAWCDIDLDGDPDLYVANTSDETNFFYLNNGDGTFVKVTTGELVIDTGESWSASWGDYNNDGYPDLFVGNNGQPNCLYRNNGDGTFNKILSGPIVTDNDHSRSSVWGDFDNDGDLDLFVSNRNDDSKLYMNKGMGNFDRYVLASGNFRGTALADMDLDGDLDLFICQDGGPNRLFENTINEGNHWLEIECIGTQSNRSAIGARVSVRAMVKGQLIWQTREISGQTGFGGQNEMIAHFGLDESEIVQTLTIQWPGGSLWDTTNVAADQRLLIMEETSQEPPLNHLPVAVIDSLTVQQDSVVTVHVLENDSDPDHDPLTIQEAGDAGTSGSIAVDPGDTTLTFTPAAGFSGEAVFEYVISDGQGGLDTAEVHITVEEGMLVREGGAVPRSFALYQNHPNPFNPVTQIRVDLPKSCEVSFVVYDVLGREIIRLINGEQAAGQYRVRWDGRDRYGNQVTSGVYFYRIETGEFVAVRKMLLVR